MRRLLKLSCFIFAVVLFGENLHAQTGVRLNEIMASNGDIENVDGTISDWVELINTTGQEVNLSGASLTESAGNPRKWSFPAGSTIPASGRLIVLLDAERPATTNLTSGELNTGFGLKAGGDDLYFFGSSAGVPLLDSLLFGLQVENLSVSRSPDGVGSWKLSNPTPNRSNSVVGLGTPGGLRVNEWMANPASGDDWFEIYNSGASPVALEGLYLTDTSADKTQHRIAPLSYIGTGINGYAQFFADGNTNNGADHVIFKLGSGSAGDSIIIYSASGAQIDSVFFKDQAVGVSEGRLPDGTSKFVKFPLTATPTQPNYLPFAGLIVSEVLSHSDPPLEDAVEFYNTTDTPINIGGWWLSDSRTQLQKYQIPANTIVPGKGYKVFYEFEFNNPASPTAFSFSSAEGDEVYLAQTINNVLTGYRVGEEFEAADNGFSIGRVQTSVPGDHKFVAMSRRTFGQDDPVSLEQFRTGTGAPNSGPRIGPIVISEIMYNPPSLDGGVTDNILDEYIEIRNITPDSIALYDVQHPTNQWKFKDAVSYSFPTRTVLGPFSYALVVPFNPGVQTAIANAFRAKYNVPGNVPLFGPYAGTLSNGGDGVELYRPDPPQMAPQPNAGFVPYIRVDKVNYTDAAPWPTSPDGTGHSLQKKNLSAFGNDPNNWEGAPTSAGRSNAQDIADTDSDGMPDVWEDANGFNKFSAADAGQNADEDGHTNIQEYLAGTDPRNAASALKVESIETDFGTGGSTVTVRFQAAANKSYTLQYRNSFSPANSWQNLADVPAGTARTVEIDDLLASSRADRYYRVVTPSVD